MAERTERKRSSDTPASLANGIPLKRLDYRVRITGRWAEVTLTQRFGNRLERPLEAVYVFPLPEEAIVAGAEITIGDRTIASELRERKEAKRAYEEARDAGHHAGLVEQERPNIFTMSVAGIEPGEEIHAVVRYRHPVIWQDGGGRYRCPLVVAPQFIPGVPVNERGDTDVVSDASRITPPVLHPSAGVPYTVSFEVDLAPGFPAAVACPSHPNRLTPISLQAGEERRLSFADLAPDGDFVLTYRTREREPVLSAHRSPFEHRGEAEEYAVVQVFPGFLATSDRPCAVILLLDDSGSMSGEKAAGSRRVVAKALKDSQRFGRMLRVGIVAFSNQPRTLVPLSPVSEVHTKALEEITGKGGTELGPALSCAMALLRNVPQDHDRCVVLVSDGDTESRQYKPVEGVRVHTIGIDSAVNDAGLKAIAEETGGGTYWVMPGEDYDAAATEMLGLMSGPVLRNVHLEGLSEGAEVTGPTDCYRLRPTTLAVRLPSRISELTVVAHDAQGTGWRATVAVQDAALPIGPQLWARAKLRELGQRQRDRRNPERDSDKTAKEMTRLSLRYGILGPTTAFVAVSEKAVPGKKPVRVDVPVVLPRTWDYDAVLGPPAFAVAGAARAGAPAGFVGAALASPTRRRTTGPALAAGAAPSAARRVASVRAGGVSRLIGDPGDVDSLAGGLDVDSLRSFDEMVAELPKGPGASELLGLAESVLARLSAGGDMATLKSDWEDLGQKLADPWVDSWSERDRCRLFELLSLISQHAGFEIEIAEPLRVMPSDLTGEAYECWERAIALPVRRPFKGDRAAR